MRECTGLTVVFITFLLSACKLHGASDEQPARIINPDDQSRAELRAAISEALQGVPVKLAADALTQDDRLFIEGVQHRDASGNLIMGYETRMPREFRLVKSGSSCYLVDTESKKRKELKQTLCEIVQ